MGHAFLITYRSLEVEFSYVYARIFIEIELICPELPYCFLDVMFHEDKLRESIGSHIESDVFNTQSFNVAPGLCIRTSCDAYRVDSAGT